MTITKITTHNTDALARLLYQYRNSTMLHSLMAALFGTQVQEIEDALWALFGLLDIDHSEGIQLDKIGTIVGHARLGMSDALYRIWLKAKIAQNVSEGDIERVISVWQLFVPGATKIHVVENFPAEVILYSNASPDPAYESLIISSMQKVVGAGIKFGWMYMFNPANAFQFLGDTGGGGFGDLDNPNIGGEFSYIIE
ncbi:MAG: DUF2612 domain-containing protein [bacterium]